MILIQSRKSDEERSMSVSDKFKTLSRHIRKFKRDHLIRSGSQAFGLGCEPQGA